MELINGGAEHTPQPGTVYDTTGLRAIPSNPYHYPLEAVCDECGKPIRCDEYGGDWYLFTREDVIA